MIIFDHVTYAYEGKETQTPSLRDCTFSVKPGELILLTGESGCGKTTIIKLVNGLLQHTGGGTLAGTVMVGGQDVAQTPLWELARTVGSVFQNPKSQFVGIGADGGLGVSEPQVPVLQSGHHQRGTFWAGESWSVPR